MTVARTKILCVDSDRTTGDWITNELRTASPAIDLSSVEGGRPALKLLYREAFDLCVIEYALPDMTGAQLCLLIRQIGYNVPIMMFTAMNRRIDREKAAAAGANEFLTKPDDMDLFFPAARRLIGMRRAIFAKDETLSGPVDKTFDLDM